MYGSCCEQLGLERLELPKSAVQPNTRKRRAGIDSPGRATPSTIPLPTSAAGFSLPGLQRGQGLEVSPVDLLL